MIKINGISFDCVVSFKRNIQIEELYRVQTADTKYHREISDKKTQIPITFGNLDKTEYDKLFEILNNKDEYHTIEIPFGYKKVKTLEAMVTNISDECVIFDGEGYYFDELTVVFDER